MTNNTLLASLTMVVLFGCGPLRTASVDLQRFRGNVSGKATLSQPTDADPVVVSLQVFDAPETLKAAIFRGPCPKPYEKYLDLKPVSSAASSLTELAVSLSSLANTYAVVVMAPGADTVGADGSGLAACGVIR